MPPPLQRLCGLCEQIDVVAAIKDLHAYEARTIPHYASYAQLVDMSVSCGLCAVLYASLFREGHQDEQSRRKSSSMLVEALRRTSSPAVPLNIPRSSTPKSFLTREDSEPTLPPPGSSITEDVRAWHEELDRKPGETPFVIEIKAESTLDADFAAEYVVRYQRPLLRGEGPRPRPLVLSNEIDVGLGIRNRPISGTPSFSVYSDWINECSAAGSKHLHCSRAEEVDLPTRLIDVGVGAGSNIPRLSRTQGMKGKYLTLSYCWGGKHSVETTTKTIAMHEEGISFSSFPKMFRDAMLITRILKYRYLWIDSLCIVQDDQADWEQECARMGNIYRNSVCTLAAPSAPNSETALLRQRTPSDLPSCRLKTSSGLITIGPPPSELKEHTSGLSRRAWVLQEQTLSPRTLCFGRNGMYFQCNSHERLESYHHPLPPERVTSWRTSQASDLPKPLITMAAADPVYWYFIVRQYTFRHLTFGTDKLPAISGLANFIAGELEDDDDICELGEYWAGLWSKDLGRGLVWTSDSSWDASQTLHAVDPSIPSWSWASQNTPVEWQVLRDFRSDFECLQGIVERVNEHQFGRVSSGRLKLSATVKSACLQHRASPSLSGLSDLRQVAELSLDHTSAAFFQAIWPEPDASLFCRLLMLGQADSSLYGPRWFALVLVPLGHEQYRRVGMASSLRRGVPHARSLTIEESWDWFGDAAVEALVIV